MRKAVEADDPELNTQKVADQVVHLKPLNDVVNTEAFKDIADKLSVLAPKYTDEFRIAAHLNGLASIMPNLIAELARRSGDTSL